MRFFRIIFSCVLEYHDFVLFLKIRRFNEDSDPDVVVDKPFLSRKVCCCLMLMGSFLPLLIVLLLPMVHLNVIFVPRFIIIKGYFPKAVSLIGKEKIM
jgi:hypothetical protein